MVKTYSIRAEKDQQLGIQFCKMCNFEAENSFSMQNLIAMILVILMATQHTSSKYLSQDKLTLNGVQCDKSLVCAENLKQESQLEYFLQF